MPDSSPRLSFPPWFDSPDAERIIETSDAIRVEDRPLLQQLCRDGFVILESEVADEIADRAVDAFWSWIRSDEELLQARDEDGHYPRIRCLHMESPDVEEVFLSSTRALRIQDALFGAPTSLYTSLFFMRGSNQPLHRDIPQFTTVPQNHYFGMWVALEDADEDNGPLTLIRGGHRVPWVDPHELALEAGFSDDEVTDVHQGLWDLYQSRVLDECRKLGLRQETVTLGKGDVLIWHPLLPHGGGEIRDRARSRFSIVFHTTPVGVPVYRERVFFGYDQNPDPEPRWGYVVHGGRRIANLPYVTFGANIPLEPMQIHDS